MKSASSPDHSLVFGSRNEYGQSFDVPTTSPFFWIFASESSSELILISEKSGKSLSFTGGGATAAARAVPVPPASSAAAPPIAPDRIRPRRPNGLPLASIRGLSVIVLLPPVVCSVASAGTVTPPPPRRRSDSGSIAGTAGSAGCADW